MHEQKSKDTSALVTEIESALEKGDWAGMKDLCDTILGIDSNHIEARTYRKVAANQLQKNSTTNDDDAKTTKAIKVALGESGSRFIGRERELELLLHSLDSAIMGSGRVDLIAGEPGIGKTRLAEEIGTIARDRHMRVFQSRCYHEHGAPPFWPWVQILQSLIAELNSAWI